MQYRSLITYVLFCFFSCLFAQEQVPPEQRYDVLILQTTPKGKVGSSGIGLKLLNFQGNIQKQNQAWGAIFLLGTQAVKINQTEDYRLKIAGSLELTHQYGFTIKNVLTSYASTFGAKFFNGIATPVAGIGALIQIKRLGFFVLYEHQFGVGEYSKEFKPDNYYKIGLTLANVF